MRISTSQITSAGVRQMLLRQAEVQHTQLQLATQLRVLKPSDDPVAATMISALNVEISQLEQYNRNADAAKTSNELEETVLSSVTDLLFRVRELTVSLGNGSYDRSALDNISVELQERLQEAVGLANTQNANGDYLFSGSQVKTQTFSKDSSGNYIYNGDQSQRLLRVSSGVVEPTSDSGFDVFVNVATGNGKFSIGSNVANTGTATISSGSYQAPPNFLAEAYSITFGTNVAGETTYTVTGDTTAAVIVPATVYQSNQEISFNGVSVTVKGEPATGDILNVAPSVKQDIFTSLQNGINAINSFVDNPAGRASFQNVLTNVQESLDNGMQNVDLTRGKIGGRLNAIDSEINTNLSLIITSKGSLSDVRDLDVVEASTRFAQQLAVLEASQASFVRIQNLSLFNFL